MGYKNLRACVDDLKRHKQLIELDVEVDPYLEIGAIQRRAWKLRSPAILFTRVRGTKFPMLANLFGTVDRTRFLFRDTLKTVENLVKIKLDPSEILKHPFRFAKTPFAALHLKPKSVRNGPIMANRIRVSELPQLVSWPKDGGAFVTLPQVYSESALKPGFGKSNLGMYRIQLSGDSYIPDQEIGLHYQIHRGIGVHHAEALEKNVPFRVNIFIGGPPAMTLASVMPLPEGLPELSFAGVLGGRRVAMVARDGLLPIPAEADFCITGTVIPGKLLPEGPFGDHLGYYSLAHDFPVLQVEEVFHRDGAIWPFTTVGRPPQEDTSFGAFIHELTGDLIPSVLPGIKAVHAVDASGVHPLLLAIGSERYTPYKQPGRPQELLTQANAILGQGQLSLAKYVFIAACEDDPELDLHDIQDFLRHMLERVEWDRDLHFQTRTTMDTLDYSHGAINEGSKVVIAACGPKRRDLPVHLPSNLPLPDGFFLPRVALPGVLVVQGRTFQNADDIKLLCEQWAGTDAIAQFPLVVIADDSEFTARTLDNFIWVTFTRSSPASDIHGVGAHVTDKHWGCRFPLVIDARIKPHHAPPLEDDPAVERRIDELARAGGPLHGII